MKTTNRFVSIPARLGKEAQLVYNDVWPGDMVDVPYSSLADEAAKLALDKLNTMLEAQIRSAFQDGKDYLVTECGVVPDDLWSGEPNFSIDVSFKGRRSEPGEFDAGLPIGWRLYRVQDWQEGNIR